MRRLVPALLLTLAFAAPAQARYITFGSNLKAKASAKRATPVDAAYWNTKLRSGGRVRVPHKGQIVGMRIKGRVILRGGTPPDVVMHLQSLRPIGGGKVRVDLTTGDLKIPFGGDPQRITAYDRRDIVNLCVHKGDYIALSTSGGYGPEHYPNGAEWAMFGRVGGSAFAQFTGAGRDNNGDVLKGRRRSGKELLMQLKLATGKAAGFCDL